MGEYEQPVNPEEEVPEEEVPEEEGEKYDGGDIPRNESSEQEA